MRVLINGVSAVAGGGLTYLANLVEWLPRLAPDDSFVFALSPSVSFETRASNIEIRSVPEAGRGVLSRFLWESAGLEALAYREKAGLVFCPANITPIRRMKIPVVLMIQNVAPLYPRVRRTIHRFEGLTHSLHMLLLTLLTRHSLTLADHVVFLSETGRRLLRKQAPGITTSVLYHGVKPRYSPDVPIPANVPEYPFFLYVSNIYAYKGLEYLVEAYKSRRDLPPAMVLGKSFSPGYFQHIQDLIKEANLERKIPFIGEVPNHELAGWYNRAIALVYPSWCESFGIPMIEAMACGTPVVAMKLGPMMEICGNAGVYADPFDGEALGRAMQAVRSDPFPEKLRSRALTRAADFPWQGGVEKLLQVFRATTVA